MQSELAVYAIYDNKGERFDTPFFAISDLFAKRRYTLMMEEKGSPLGRWPDEFALYKLSDFDIETGKMLPEKKLVFEGKTLVKKGEQQK